MSQNYLSHLSPGSFTSVVNLTYEYIRKFSLTFEMVPTEYSGPWKNLFVKKKPEAENLVSDPPLREEKRHYNDPMCSETNYGMMLIICIEPLFNNCAQIYLL